MFNFLGYPLVRIRSNIDLALFFHVNLTLLESVLKFK